MEKSPHLSAGRPGRQSAGRLSLDDFAALVAAAAPWCVGIAGHTAAEPLPGVALRIDATDGLTRDLVALAEAARAASAFPLVAVSCFAAGDLTIVKEGVARVDPRLVPLLRRAGGATANEPAAIGVLAEIGDAFLATGRRPWTVYAELAARLKDDGLAVIGTAIPDDGCAATDFSLLATHVGMFAGAPESCFEPYGLFGRELFNLEGAGKADLLTCLDRFKAVRLRGPLRPPVYSRRLRRPIGPRARIDIAFQTDMVLSSSVLGWKITRRSDAKDARSTSWEIVDTATAVDLVGSAAAHASILVLCQPAHFVGATPRARPLPGEPRGLPAPFDSYLAISSDVDWSTPARMAAYQTYLNEDLGLPVAGSFFLRTTASAWATAFGRDGRRRARDPESGFCLELLAARGELDTFHHLTNALLQVRLAGPDADDRYAPSTPTPLGWGEGFLVLSRRPCRELRLAIVGEPPLTLVCRASQAVDALGRHQGFAPLPTRAWSDEAPWSIQIPGGDAEATIVLIDMDPAVAAGQLRELADRGVRASVYVPHGNNVREVANLRTAQAEARQPGSSAFDMDEPASVFNVIEPLWDGGLRLIALIGGAYRGDLVERAALLKTRRLRTGRETWTFGRFHSRRGPELGFHNWLYGKGAAHAAGIGFQISDALQRLPWCVAGSGGVLYTHLGHTQFNQASARFDWPVETHLGFEALAQVFHPDGEEAPACRPWVAATSTILLHKIVAEAMRTTTRYAMNHVAIAPWADTGLDLGLGAEGAHLHLLHGQCFFVPDARRATASLDGVAITTLARTMASEEPPSITIVDDSAPTPLLLAANSITIQASNAHVQGERNARDWRAEGVSIEPAGPHGEVVFCLPAASLRHQDAWMIDVRCADLAPLEIGLRDRRGEFYVAGHGFEACWALHPEVPADEDGWRRLVFQFGNRKGHPAGRPRGGIVALRIRWWNAEPAGRFELRRAALLRPRSLVVPPPVQHFLGGRVLDPAGRALPCQAVRIVATSGSERSVKPDESGFFELAGLPRHGIFQVRAVSDRGASRSIRGRAFAATRDCWDWDFVLPFEEAEEAEEAEEMTDNSSARRSSG